MKQQERFLLVLSNHLYLCLSLGWHPQEYSFIIINMYDKSHNCCMYITTENLGPLLSLVFIPVLRTLCPKHCWNTWANWSASYKATSVGGKHYMALTPNAALIQSQAESVLGGARFYWLLELMVRKNSSSA